MRKILYSSVSAIALVLGAPVAFAQTPVGPALRDLSNMAPTAMSNVANSSFFGTDGVASSMWINYNGGSPCGSCRLGVIPVNVPRLFVGVGASVNIGNFPESPQDWLTALIPIVTTSSSQLVSLSSIGQSAATFGSKTSQFGGVTTMTVVNFVGVNDNLSFNDTAEAGYIEAHRYNHAGTALGLEIDPFNFGNVCPILPSNFFPSDPSTPFYSCETAGLWLQAGNRSGGVEGTSVSPSAAIGILDGLAVTWEAGIVAKAAAFDTSRGAGGEGIFADLYAGQSIRWTDGSGSTVAELWGTSVGIATTQKIQLEAGASVSNNENLAFKNSSGSNDAYIFEGAGGGLNFGAGTANTILFGNNSLTSLLDYNETTTGSWSFLAPTVVSLPAASLVDIANFFTPSMSNGQQVYIGIGEALASNSGFYITYSHNSTAANRFLSIQPFEYTPGGSSITLTAGSNFGIDNTAPAANLTVGQTAATTRVYNTRTDASNGEWAYMGDWGFGSNIATYGTDKNGSGVARAVQILTGGTAAVTFDTSQNTKFAGTVSIPNNTDLYFNSSGGSADAHIFEGPGGGFNIVTGSSNTFAISNSVSGDLLDYNETTAATMTLPTPGVAMPSLPSSAGSGGLFMCVDNVGKLYIKAVCP